jgi:hypothetical protein
MLFLVFPPPHPPALASVCQETPTRSQPQQEDAQRPEDPDKKTTPQETVVKSCAAERHEEPQVKKQKTTPQETSRRSNPVESCATEKHEEPQEKRQKTTPQETSTRSHATNTGAMEGSQEPQAEEQKTTPQETSTRSRPVDSCAMEKHEEPQQKKQKATPQETSTKSNPVESCATEKHEEPQEKDQKTTPQETSARSNPLESCGKEKQEEPQEKDQKTTAPETSTTCHAPANPAEGPAVKTEFVQVKQEPSEDDVDKHQWRSRRSCSWDDEEWDTCTRRYSWQSWAQPPGWGVWDWVPGSWHDDKAGSWGWPRRSWSASSWGSQSTTDSVASLIGKFERLHTHDRALSRSDFDSCSSPASGATTPAKHAQAEATNHDNAVTPTQKDTADNTPKEKDNGKDDVPKEKDNGKDDKEKEETTNADNAEDKHEPDETDKYTKEELKGNSKEAKEKRRKLAHARYMRFFRSVRSRELTHTLSAAVLESQTPFLKLSPSCQGKKCPEEITKMAMHSKSCYLDHTIPNP